MKTLRTQISRRASALAAAVAAFALCASSVHRTEAANRYKPPFDVEKQRAAWGHPMPPLANCPAPPPPVADLTHIIFYSDRAQSVVDRDKLRQQMAQTENIRRFAGSLNRMADDYITSKPADSARARCVMNWLVAWADGNAFLGNVEFWARFDTVWFGSVPTNFAYLKVRDDPSISADERHKVEQWLARVAKAGIAGNEAREKIPGITKVSNGLYWVGDAAILAGVSSGDRELFEFGVDAARRGLDTVTPEGLLSAELERKGRAFSYMNWALEPLTTIVATAKANGIDLTQQNHAALSRIFRFFATTKNDPDLVERLTGTKQDLNPGIWPRNAQDITFVETYLSIGNDADLDAVARRLRPVNQPTFGGNYTLLYSTPTR